MAAAAPSPLASSVEKTNGAKLSRLLIDGGTTVLRIVFDHYHSPANLTAGLNANYLTLNNLLRRRVLRPAQWDQLFPPGGATPDSKTFDITLLFLLLTNICGLSPPLSGWHIKPSPSDTSFEANLARIKFFRNELYGHVTSTGVDTPSFNGLWLEISAVLVALGLDQAEVDRLKAERCGEDDYLDVLLDWADSEQDIKSQLKDILQELHKIDIDTKKARQTQLEDHTTLQESVVKLKGISMAQTETLKAVEDIKEEFENVKRIERDREEELLRKLAKSEFKGDIENHATKFQKGTREWIFKRVDEWLDDRSSRNRVMVISGSAGMGKSVISSVICKRMQEAGRLSGSHFCQHNNVRYRKPQLMLQSLACHLSHALPEYKDALVDQLSRNLGPVELNSMGVEELFALLFKEPLTNIADPGRNMLIVIDGLDESEYQGRNELLDVIAHQFCKLPSWISFFVTTRPEINIADSLKHFQPIQLEENQDENLRDIRLFFEMQLSHGIEQGDKDVLLRRLVERSEGVFLYAYFLTDFIKTNVSILNPEQLESSLPLGISSVYLSHFKRLENELCKELKIEEDQMLSFLCAVTASREPLPVSFLSRLLGLSEKPLSFQRKINKAIACISSVLPVRDHCLHFFHKSVKDWLTNTSRYGRHDFTVDEKEGHEILFDLCRNEFDKITRKGANDTQFTDTERYALQHGVQHMIEVDELGEKLRPCSVEELVCMYVADLELIYAKLCVNSTVSSEDICSVQKHFEPALFGEGSRSLLISLLNVLRKHAYLLREHPHLWFQSLINEGSSELSSRAEALLEERLSSVPYMKYLGKEEEKGAVQARFYCSDKVACFDVSPEMDYMVCECRDGTIHMWSLETGNKEWIRPSLRKRTYTGVHRDCDVYSDLGAYHWRGHKVQTYYRSVVFHPTGKNILPGTLGSVYNLQGDHTDLFPKSKCTFSQCAFPGDKRTILTDSLDNSKKIVLWSMETGEELTVIAWAYDVLSFAISQDGSQIAFGDATCSIYLADVEKRQVKCLFKLEDDACGLMHFSPDNEALVCGYLNYRMEGLGGFLCGFVSDTDTKPSFLCYQLKTVPVGHPQWLTEREFTLWPIEPTSLARKCLLGDGFPCSWENNVHYVFPSLQDGFYKKLNEETVLVGGPSFKYVAAVNAVFLNEMNSPTTSQVVKEVVFSSEGNAIYSITLDENDVNASEVIVTVFRMSSQKLLTKKTFTCQSLCLVPTKEGVLLCFKADQAPELWDFELSECIRTIDRLTGAEKFIHISDDLMACQLPRRTLTLDEMRSDNSVKLIVLDEQDDSSNEDVSRILSGFTEYLHSFYQTYRMLPVNFINVNSGEFISCVKTKVDHGNKDVVFISCNSQKQLLVCTRENMPGAVIPEDELTVSLRNSNELNHVWQRSTKLLSRKLTFTPDFIFSPEERFVVTWRTLNNGYGLHVLDAKTGETYHTLLKDRDDMVDCKFVVNGDTLVCCSGDNFVRLFNALTGDLLSVLDIVERPFCLGACLDKHLVAIALSGARLKFIHVELPKVKETEEKKGSFVKG